MKGLASDEKKRARPEPVLSDLVDAFVDDLLSRDVDGNLTDGKLNDIEAEIVRLLGQRNLGADEGIELEEEIMSDVEREIRSAILSVLRKHGLAK